MRPQGPPGITVQWFPQRELNLRIIYSLHDKKNRTKIDEYFSWPELDRSLRGGYPWPSFLHQSSFCWPSAGCCRNCTSHSSIRLKSSRGSVDIWVSFNGQETKELSIWKETHKHMVKKHITKHYSTFQLLWGQGISSELIGLWFYFDPFQYTQANASLSIPLLHALVSCSLRRTITMQSIYL